MKAHILYQESDFDVSDPGPANQADLIQDLELTTVFNAMANGDKFLFELVIQVMMVSLEDCEAIRYRQDVLKDAIAHPDVIRQIYAIATEGITNTRRRWWFDSSHPTSIRSAAVEQLEGLLVYLKELRQLADTVGDNFRSTGMTTLFRSLQKDLDDTYLHTVTSHLKQVRFPEGELLRARLGNDNSSVGFMLLAPGKLRASWKARLGIAPRDSYLFSLAPRDEAGAQYLADLSNRGLNLAANTLAQAADHIRSYFTMLRIESGFYVGCLNLRDSLQEKSVPVAFPNPLPWDSGRLAFTGLRDVALCLRSRAQIVPNEIDTQNVDLVIITGANSGGKSTFLRSVGQAQLLMQCGMFVVAESFDACVSKGIFSHFIRDEDKEMNHGRLDDELNRMSVIVDALREHSLVLFNESFASTNEQEGSEIGRQVVSALLESNIRIFFVTHQYALAESFETRLNTLFLRAERNDQGRREFRLVEAKALSTSYGEDLYYRLGGWLGEGADQTGQAPEAHSVTGTIERKAV